MGQYGETRLETSDTREIRAGAPVHTMRWPLKLSISSLEILLLLIMISVTIIGVSH